jgi:hypothetical protein
MHLARCAVVLGTAGLYSQLAWPVELVCPPAERVTLIAAFPGWHDDAYSPRSGPRLAFEGMRLDQEMITCRYTVEGAKLISFRRYAKCVVAKGTWQEQGIIRLCQASSPGECTLDCSSVQEAK